MLPEPLILSPHESGLEGLRDGLDRDKDAPFGGQFGHEPRIGGIDPRHLRRLVIGQPAIIRQVRHDLVPEGDASHARADHAHRDQREQSGYEAGQTAGEARAAPCLRLCLGSGLPPGRRRHGRMAGAVRIRNGEVGVGAIVGWHHDGTLIHRWARRCDSVPHMRTGGGPALGRQLAVYSPARIPVARITLPQLSRSARISAR